VTAPVGRRPLDLRDVRLPYAPLLVALMAVATCAAILYRTRRFGFLDDEWDFILDARRWQALDYFRPHNEHWSTIPQIIYRVLEAAMGVRSYIPYEAALLVAHGATAVLLFLLIRRRAGDILGLLAAAVILVVGRGFDNILWAFQVSFVGSVATGLLALWLLDRPAPGWGRMLGASAALLASLMFSGVGPVLVLLVAVDLALDRERRPALVTLVPPVVAATVWYLTVGRSGVAQDTFRISLREYPVLLEYVPNGIGVAAAGLFGLSASWSRVAVAVLAGAVAAAAARDRRPNGRMIAAAVTLVALYTLTGIERGKMGVDQAGSPRYVYLGAVFTLLVLVEVVRNVRWRSVWAAGIAVVAVAGALHSLMVLDRQILLRNAMSAREVVQLQTVANFCSMPGLPPTMIGETLYGVSPVRYCEGIKTIGSPVAAASLAEAQRRDPVTFDATLRLLTTGSVRVQTDDGSPPQARCAIVAPDTVIDVRPGGAIQVGAPRGGIPVGVSLSSALPPPPDPSAMVVLPAPKSMILLPEPPQQSIRWKVGLSPAAGVPITACWSP
jgi:hypothetical protein